MRARGDVLPARKPCLRRDAAARRNSECAAESRRDGGDAGGAWATRDGDHGARDHDIDVWL